ncbi:hypothetical protein E4U21_006166 [Claviceps maximensis]|nr:hypothetical protein E4U21_006166 [Claviceps maximensis]
MPAGGGKGHGYVPRTCLDATSTIDLEIHAGDELGLVAGQVAAGVAGRPRGTVDMKAAMFSGVSGMPRNKCVLRLELATDMLLRSACVARGRSPPPLLFRPFWVYIYIHMSTYLGQRQDAVIRRAHSHARAPDDGRHGIEPDLPRPQRSRGGDLDETARTALLEEVARQQDAGGDEDGLDVDAEDEVELGLSQSPRLVTSVSTRSAAPPRCEAADCPASCATSAMTTRAPSWENFSAMPLPKPDAAPVTMATLPWRRPVDIERQTEHSFPGRLL